MKRQRHGPDRTRGVQHLRYFLPDWRWLDRIALSDLFAQAAQGFPHVHGSQQRAHVLREAGIHFARI
jgi:hypothetical protein